MFSICCTRWKGIKNSFKEILEQYILKNVSETVERIAFQFSPNIHGYRMMNLNDFGDPPHSTLWVWLCRMSPGSTVSFLNSDDVIKIILRSSLDMFSDVNKTCLCYFYYFVKILNLWFLLNCFHITLVYIPVGMIKC